jgi:hypothetical protein
MNLTPTQKVGVILFYPVNPCGPCVKGFLKPEQKALTSSALQKPSDEDLRRQ